MKYTYNKDKVVDRMENENATLVLVKDAQYRLALNETGKLIYDMLDEFSTVESLALKVQNLYPDMKKESVFNDVIEIMRCFETYGIIEIADESNNEESSMDSMHLEFTGDLSYKITSNFIMGDNLEIIKMNTSSEYYSPVGLRLRVMRNIEYQIIARVNDKIIMYMAVTNKPEGISKVIAIKDLIVDKQVNKEERKVLIEQGFEKAYKLYADRSTISKFRVTTNGCPKELLLELAPFGFAEECCLENETTYGDVSFISKIL